MEGGEDEDIRAEIVRPNRERHQSENISDGQKRNKQSRRKRLQSAGDGLDEEGKPPVTSAASAQIVADSMCSQLSDRDFKSAGNKLCLAHRYDEALICYNKAIAKAPETAVHFSNRALCQLKLQQWPAAIQDARRALELEPNLIKAHFFLGQALAETANFDEAIKHLQRAHELAREKKLNFGDDIAYQIRLTKRRRWSKSEEAAAQLENELHDYLIGLVRRDKDRQLMAIRERLEGLEIGADEPEGGPSKRVSRGEGSAGISTEQSSSVSNYAQLEGKPEAETVEMIKSKRDSYIDKLEAIFENLKLQRKRRDVPDYLCGKISFEIMQDPVITPSGITYDRQDIEEHLKRVGHFDPITRQPLSASQLISNLSMKEVVDAYLNENEWALYY